jgi:O-antigen ligase
LIPSSLPKVINSQLPPRDATRRYGLLASNPINDLGLILCLIPFWWILGIESIIIPIGCFLIFLKVLAIYRGIVSIPVPLKWLAAFLTVYLISGAFIVESFRLITFIRNFSVLLTAFFIAIIVVNSASDWKQIRFILKVIVVLAGISIFFGLLAMLDIWRPTISSLIGRFLPDWIADTNYGRTIVFRKLGNLAYYQMIGLYYRVNSFFAYAILYASALAFMIPIVYYYQRIANRRITRYISVLILTGLIINLIFTTGRIAILGLMVGGLYYLIFVIRKTSTLRIPLFIMLLGLISAGLILTFINFEDLSSSEQFSDISYFLFYGRGASTNQRLYVYQETISGWLERPFFGWGTERDIPDFKYPAGSHSFYFGLLYRQGIFGLFTFTMVMLSIWRTSAPKRLENDTDLDNHHLNRFLEIGRWVFITAIIDALTTDPILDIMTMSILWLIFGSLLAANKVLARKWEFQLIPKKT